MREDLERIGEDMIMHIIKNNKHASMRGEEVKLFLLRNKIPGKHEFNNLHPRDQAELIGNGLVSRYDNAHDKMRNWHPDILYLIQEDSIWTSLDLRGFYKDYLKKNTEMLILRLRYTREELNRSHDQRIYIPTILEEMELACSKQ